MTYHSAPLPWEVGVFDAQEAVRRGRTPPLEAYLRDAAKGAALIADAADPGDGVPTLISSMSDRAKGGSKVQDKFDGTSGQIKQAIDRGSVPVIGCYLRELSELFNLMASALSNNDPRAEWKLSFARRWPGRPVDPKKLFVEQDIQMRLWSGKRRGIKQESTVKELMDEYGLSRAAIMRINQSLKAKSHKRADW